MTSLWRDISGIQWGYDLPKLFSTVKYYLPLVNEWVIEANDRHCFLECMEIVGHLCRWQVLRVEGQ